MTDKLTARSADIIARINAESQSLGVSSIEIFSIKFRPLDSASNETYFDYKFYDGIYNLLDTQPSANGATKLLKDNNLISLHSHESGLEILGAVGGIITIGYFLKDAYLYFTKAHLNSNSDARFSIEVRKIDASGNLEEKKILVKSGDKPLTPSELKVIAKALD